jgi:hypothetical protein
MIEVGNIVTLEDNLEYLLLEETTKNNVKYLYAVRVLIDETPTDEYLIFEAIKDADGEYLKVVEDKALFDELIEDFKDIVSAKILSDDFMKTGSNE